MLKKALLILLFFLGSLSPVFAQYKTENTVQTNIGNPVQGTDPNQNDCNGVYANDLKVNTWKVNYGDPQCEISGEFNKPNNPLSKIASTIQKYDAANVYRWYNVIAWCESRYDANAEGPPTYDPAYSWGLFQMGRGLNGQYDHGDVYWQDQITNAITYNKLIGGSFLYWSTRNADPANCR